MHCARMVDALVMGAMHCAPTDDKKKAVRDTARVGVMGELRYPSLVLYTFWQSPKFQKMRHISKEMAEVTLVCWQCVFSFTASVIC